MTEKKIVGIRTVKAGSRPDFDIDVNNEFRKDLTEHHLEDVYGTGTTSHINTFGKMLAKGALKAEATIYRIPFDEANETTKLMPGPVNGKQMTLEDIFDTDSSRYDEAHDFRVRVSNSIWKEPLAGAKAIEGRVKSTGIHACGILMSSEKLDDIIPMKYEFDKDSKEWQYVSQWSYPECEALGLVKMDFLGLDTLDLHMKTVRHIMRAGKTPPSIPDLLDGDMDDEKTFELFRSGNTMGVFQFVSDGAMDLLRRAQPTNIGDLGALTALYRPGPMDVNAHTTFADRKAGREGLGVPIHKDFVGSPLEEILAETYNVIVYQEQVMAISNQISGMTLQEGDDFRRAMGKKKRSVMESMKGKFIGGGVSNGYSEDAMNLLWDTIEAFAGYAFNKCLHGRTLVSTENGKVSVENLFEEYKVNSKKDFYIHSMYDKGEIRLNKIKNIVQTGLKPTYRIKTASGKHIEVTIDHRMLTSKGYATIGDGGLSVGSVLVGDAEWEHRGTLEADKKGLLEGANKESFVLSGETKSDRQDNKPCYEDTVVSIEEPKMSADGKCHSEMTYDIEMELDGPSNFIANGLVSHNSHSVAYVFLSYASAYLKTYYPVEFMAALLSQNIGNADKRMETIKECRRMGISLGTVDINASDVAVAPDVNNVSEYDIIYGFNGVKHMSNDSAQIIIDEREENGKFASLDDVVSRCYERGLHNKRAYECLALAGAFDTLGVNRRSAFESISGIISRTKKDIGLGGVDSLFSMFDEGESQVEHLFIKQSPEYDWAEKLSLERDMIGMYLTGHPMDKLTSNDVEKLGDSSLEKLKDFLDLPAEKMFEDSWQSSKEFNVVGVVTEIKEKSGSKGRRISATIDDKTAYLSLPISKDLTKRMDKWRDQEGIKKTYIAGAKDVSDDLISSYRNNKTLPLAELNTKTVYKFKVKVSKSKTNKVFVSIVAISPVTLAQNGMLPVRLRFKYPQDKNQYEKVTQRIAKFPQYLSEKCPGNTPIVVAPYCLNNPLIIAKSIGIIPDQVINDAIRDILESDSKSPKKERAWPPKKREHSRFYTVPLDGCIDTDYVDFMDYRDTGLTVDNGDNFDMTCQKEMSSFYDFDSGNLTKRRTEE